MIIGRQGALCGNVFLVQGKFNATEHALAVTPASNIEISWLYYMLAFLILDHYSIGQAQPGLSVTVLEKPPVSIPSDTREPQQIAQCLLASAATPVLSFGEPRGGGLELRAQFGGADGGDNGQLLMGFCARQ